MDYTMEELLPVVGKLMEKYTSLSSTSVTYETAQQLMGAVLYCLGSYKPNKLDENGKRVEIVEKSISDKPLLRQSEIFSLFNLIDSSVMKLTDFFLIQTA